jgi:hypothetical protein
MGAILAKIGWGVLSCLLTESFGKEFLVHTIYYAAKKWDSDYWTQIAKDVAKSENVTLPA